MKQKAFTGLSPAVGKGFRAYADFPQQRNKKNNFFGDSGDAGPAEMGEKKKRAVTKKAIIHHSAADELPDPDEDRPE